MLERNLTQDKLKAVEIEFLRRKKETLTAYILLIFFWYFGLHKFYIGKMYEGILYLVAPISGFILAIFGFLGMNTSITYIGMSLIAGIAGLLLYDIFTLWKQVEKANEKIYAEIFEKITGIPYSSRYM